MNKASGRDGIPVELFQILKDDAGIPSPPLALFVVMLSQAHLTSLSRMSGSRSVITPSWLSGSWGSFLHSFSIYSCHLFLISSASDRSISFLSFILPIFAWNILLVYVVFLKRSLVFSILLFCSISLHLSLKKSFLISPCYSLELCIQICPLRWQDDSLALSPLGSPDNYLLSTYFVPGPYISEQNSLKSLFSQSF